MGPVYLSAEGRSVFLDSSHQASTSAASTQGWPSVGSTADAVSVVLLHSKPCCPLPSHYKLVVVTLRWSYF